MRGFGHAPHPWCVVSGESAQEGVDRDGDEEDRDVGDGPVEQAHLLELRARHLGLGTVLQTVRLPQPPAARHQGDQRVEPAGVAEGGEERETPTITQL